MDRTTRALAELRDVVAALRAPGGCPWDQEQKLSDMGRYILEESCEVQDAITDSNGAASAEVCEELGDVLMNIFLASVIAEEKDDFTLADVAVFASVHAFLAAASSAVGAAGCAGPGRRRRARPCGRNPPGPRAGGL